VVLTMPFNAFNMMAWALVAIAAGLWYVILQNLGFWCRLAELLDYLLGWLDDATQRLNRWLRTLWRDERGSAPEGGVARCVVCGEPMPPGEQMFQYHGYSGPCPKGRGEQGR
jgi:hypothetical protein